MRYLDARSKKRYSSTDMLIIALSIYISVFLAYISLSGQIWIYLPHQTVALWITLLVAAVLAAASMIFTHTLIIFTQQRQTRNLLILLLSFDIILTAILYLLSHASFETYSIFADKQRNRTMIVAFGLVISSFSLGGTVSRESLVNNRITVLALLWGILLLPFMSLWFLVSPDPVFQVTLVQGIFGLNPLGWLFVFIIGFGIISSFFRYIKDWRNTRDSVSLSFVFALMFWTFSIIIVVIMDTPLQMGEIIWFGSFTGGFVVIAIAMIATAILEPRKALEDTVAQRTQELSVSKKESEFYLGMWTHKMGNLLQGLLVYLDLLSESETFGADAIDHRRSAMEIAREATLLNTQVTMLSQASDIGSIERNPISLAGVISSAMDMSSKLLNPDTFRVNFISLTDIQVMGDKMLDVALLSILSFFVRTRLHEDLNITIRYEQEDNFVKVLIECAGAEFPIEIKDFLKEHAVPQTPSIELDIYVARTILDLFNGRIEYERLVKEKINRLTCILDAVT
jgi:hypothetical protein